MKLPIAHTLPTIMKEIATMAIILFNNLVYAIA
jgi:hypothetical protein